MSVVEQVQAEKSTDPVLRIEHLSVAYGHGANAVVAVEDMSFSIAPGEVVGLAGESGSGKSTLAFAVTRLLRPPAHRVAGRVILEGIDVYSLSDEELQRARWAKVAIVFQSALNSLNPVLTVGTQIADAIQAHERVSRQDTIDRVAELFKMVDLDPNRLRSYPHQLSGGQRQRAVIAMALALRPPLVIFDEPTTALDVVVQRDILQQVKELQRQLGFSVLFITHDLSLLGELADRVLIMYAGRLMEAGPTDLVYSHPLHPYTQGLMASFPSVFEKKQDLQGIPGSPPDMRHPPSGCRFHPRCPYAMDICRVKQPPLIRMPDHPDHLVACHLYTGEEVDE